MNKEIEEALSKKDYQKVEILLEELREQNPENDWLKYYEGCLEESKNNLEIAEKIYLEILKNSFYPNPKLFSLIRNRINAIKKIEIETKATEFEQFQKVINSEELSILIIEPMPTENKKIAAQNMAKIMNIDAYSARLKIPSRSLKMNRIGKLGELKYYESKLNQANIPSFCCTFQALNNINIYQVNYVKSIDKNLILCYENELQEPQEIIINPLEIKQKISGLLPLFELTVHQGVQGKLAKKITVLDYIQFCDLHLINQNIILRFDDYNYQFDQGINLKSPENTSKKNWLNFCQIIDDKIPNIPNFSEFTLFGEDVIQFPEMLKQITPQLRIFRREQTPWDCAFQLYSTLLFCKLLC